MKRNKGSFSSGKRGPMGFTGLEKFVTLSPKPESIEIDLHRTAVIVVDMQNAFLSREGYV
ncbi:MAG: hypothetical protein QGG48_02745 [Desulfatiglandales bacterium]|jgi:hypothetical protein|nr:hypothetical protein [Desulfatiglandales bacterium]